MNDLKLVVHRNEDNLENEIKFVKTISKDINMNFGLGECARICLKKVGSKVIYIYIGSIFEKGIQELDPRESYKYLGIEESHNMHHENEKEKLKKEYWRRLRLVLGKVLRAKNKIQAIGSFLVPALRYSFGIVNWHQEELQN